MALGTNHMTNTTAANFIPELWALDVVEAVEANLVMGGLVQNFSDLLTEGGDTIHIPKVSNFTAQNKTAQQQVTLQATTEDKVTMLINLHKEVSFLIEDITAVQAKHALRQIYTKKAGYAIAKAIDSALLALYADLSTNVVSCGAAVSDAELLSAIKKLDLQDVPDTDRHMVAYPTVKFDLLGIDRYVQSLTVEGRPVETGVISTKYGVMPHFTTNVPMETISSVDTRHNMIFHREAFAVAFQLGPRTQANYVPEYLSNLVTIDVVFGVKTIREEFAVDFQSNDGA